MFVILLLSHSIKIFAQYNVYWEKSIDTQGSSIDQPTVALSSDNKIIFSNISFLTAGGARTANIFKVDKFGNQIWNVNLKGTAEYRITSFVQHTSGDIYFTGEDQWDIWLVRVSSDGQILWKKNYGGNRDEISNNLLELNNGNLLLCGSIDTVSAVIGQVHLLCVNPDGNKIWSKTYICGDQFSGSSLSSIIQLSDGNILVAGSSSGIALVMKLNFNGDSLWVKTYPKNTGGFNKIHRLTKISDNEIMVSESESLFAIDSTGRVLWEKKSNGIGEYGTILSVCPINSNIIYTGVVRPYNSSYSSNYLELISEKGTSIWFKGIGSYQWTGLGTYVDFTSVCSLTSSNLLLAGRIVQRTSNNEEHKLLLRSVILDQFAKKDSLFTFKIPVEGDSLNYEYVPLLKPYEMEISQGGSISWIPKSDSIIIDTIKVIVRDDNAHDDTLVLTIWVNKMQIISSTKYYNSSRTSSEMFDRAIYSRGNLYLKIRSPIYIKNLNCLDIKGRIVFEKKINKTFNLGLNVIPFNDVADNKVNGVYLLQLVSQDNAFQFKTIISAKH